MFPTLLTTLFLAIIPFTKAYLESTNLPDCQCLTGWETSDLTCTSSSQSTIYNLEYFLKNNDCEVNCQSFNSSSPSTVGYNCQRAYALLTQYHDYCTEYITDDELFHMFTDYCYTCAQIMNEDDSSSLSDCSSVTCDTTTMETSVVALYDNCVIENATDCSSSCSTQWLTVSSYHKHCTPLSSTFTSFYKSAIKSSSACEQQCMYADIADRLTYDTECSSKTKNEEFYDLMVDMGGSVLDVSELNVVCFLGINYDDPSTTTKICYDASTNISSGGFINSTTAMTSISTAFFDQFSLTDDLHQLWILVCSILVFIMQLGFTLLEAGIVKSNNVQNILFKNLMNCCLTAIVFYIYGYSVAYGSSTSSESNGFIGVDDITIESVTYNQWFSAWLFTSTCTTVISGALAERCTLKAYFIYTIIVSIWIYPIIVHWTWSSTGWISAFNSDVDDDVYGGALDTAGSGVVHVVAGVSALIGTVFLGPRLRRFDVSAENKASKHYAELQHQFTFGHNIPFQVLGTFLLWFGWYGYNAGRVLSAAEIDGSAMNVASKICVTTTLSACAGGLTATMLSKVLLGYWSVVRVCNGILAGCVGICAGCAIVHPAFAILIGTVSGFIYYGVSLLVEKMKIDDPLDVFAVHGCCGIWGILAVGLMTLESDVSFAFGSSSALVDVEYGERLGMQICLVVVIVGWTVVNSGLMFWLMSSYVMGILRIGPDIERIGMDIVEHGGQAVHWGKVYSNVAQQK